MQYQNWFSSDEESCTSLHVHVYVYVFFFSSHGRRAREMKFLFPVGFDCVRVDGTHKTNLNFIGSLQGLKTWNSCAQSFAEKNKHTFNFGYRCRLCDFDVVWDVDVCFFEEPVHVGDELQHGARRRISLSTFSVQFSQNGFFYLAWGSGNVVLLRGVTSAASGFIVTRYWFLLKKTEEKKHWNIGLIVFRLFNFVLAWHEGSSFSQPGRGRKMFTLVFRRGWHFLEGLPKLISRCTRETVCLTQLKAITVHDKNTAWVLVPEHKLFSNTNSTL